MQNMLWWCGGLHRCLTARVPGLNPDWGLSVWSLYILPVYVLSGYSGFLPPPKNVQIRLSLRVSVSMHGYVSHLSLCGHVWTGDLACASRPLTGGINSSPLRS